MIGGDGATVAQLEPVWQTLAPGIEAASRTPGRKVPLSPVRRATSTAVRLEPGHFVKMIHNGIEYGLMAAYAEGLAILERANLGAAGRKDDAETAPLPDARAISLRHRRGRGCRSVAKGKRRYFVAARSHRRGPAIRPRAGELSRAMSPTPGEGRWTVQSAVDLGCRSR